MEIRIPASDRAIPGHLAVPEPRLAGAGPWPGVVVAHDAFGVTDDTRAVAARFATAGYLALAPDLYSRGRRLQCAISVFRQLLHGSGQAFGDVEAARDLLRSRSDCTGAVGIVGFCQGGGFALLLAPGFDASAPYYGGLPKDLSPLDGACPIVASYGGRDRALAGTAERLEVALRERDVPHDVKEYPDAGHGFANRVKLGPLAPLAKVTGFGYHHESAEDAWRRVLLFFREHLDRTES